MHLSRILDQIKRHPSPTEALTKLGKAMDKHEDNLLEKGFRILKSELCANVYEAINGPHFGRRTRIPRLDQVIPKVTTISVSDTDEVTTLGICPRIWCQLPNEGLMVFEARHTPAEASASLPVVISTTGSVSPAANSKSVPVVKSDSTPLVGSEIQAGNRYWIYYNKCDNVMQVMNHYPAATA